MVEGVNPITTGLGAGLGIGAGVVGLMTAFGTAGTGAAISGLGGAAYISSLLAALGEGTLASGGLGMTGGMMVLGTTVFLPAIAVAGIVTYDKLGCVHTKESIIMAKRIKPAKTISSLS